MSQLPTVRIKHASGSAVINASDFDSSKHQLYVEPETPVTTNVPEPASSENATADAPDNTGAPVGNGPQIPDFSGGKPGKRK